MQSLKFFAIAVSFLLVALGGHFIFFRTESLRKERNSSAQNVTQKSVPAVLSEFKKFERVFHGQKNLSWHIVADRALVYEKDTVEFENFKIELNRGGDLIKILGEWGIAEINHNSVRSLRADGGIEVNFLNKSISLKARECSLSNGGSLSCSIVVIETERWITSAKEAELDLNHSDLTLRGRVKTVAFQ